MLQKFIGQISKKGNVEILLLSFIHRNGNLWFYSSLFQHLRVSTTKKFIFSLKNLNISRPKVTKFALKITTHERLVKLTLKIKKLTLQKNFEGQIRISWEKTTWWQIRTWRSITFQRSWFFLFLFTKCILNLYLP
jgi:hypothetical protein